MRAELVWTALVTALEVGDDAAALAARDRLAPVLEGIQDSYLHAVSNMAMAWTSPILGDFDGALRQASVSLEELRGQDEPLWMVLAVGSAGALETVVGRYDDVFGHLRTARDLGERFDNTWLATFSRVQQGILAVEQGRLEDARAQLEGALELSMAARSTRSVTLCLAAFAQLAFAAGEPERAALLAGAAEGLRRRVGLRTWPMLRRGKAELVAQLRQGPGGRPLRRGLRRRRPTQPAGGGCGRPRPARRRHSSPLSRGQGHRWQSRWRRRCGGSCSRTSGPG